MNEQNVRKAMDQAVKYLFSVANAKGVWDSPKRPDIKGILTKGVRGGTALMDSQWPGVTALVLNALASAGRQSDPRFKKALAWLMAQEMVGTYGIGMRLELIHRLKDPAPFRDVLRRDVRMLAKGLRTSKKEGAMWQYVPPPTPTFYSYIGDFSNTNYGVLGLWAASDEHIEIPSKVWRALEKTYIAGQLENGAWAYYHGMHKRAQASGAGGQSASMTTAGMASLYLILDQLYVRRGPLGAFRRTKAYKSIQAGMKWMTANYSATVNAGWPEFTTYYFYNCERVAQAAGLKYFGKHDWFRTMAATLLRVQRKDGSVSYKTPAQYGGVPVDTAFCLLFLAKGSAPVLFNKLQHAGDWDNHIRELAALTEWFGRLRERPANWQVVNLDVPAEELTDCRILYIAGTRPLTFAAPELAKLKRFVEMGGLLVFHPDKDMRPFTASAKAVLAKLFPKLEVQRVDLSTHRIGSVYKPLGDRRIVLEQLASPVRVFAFILHGDPAKDWEGRRGVTARGMFDLGAALHYFANDRAMLRDMPTKLARFGDVFAGPVAEAPRAVKLARIRYGENPHRWNPEPLAFERFARRMAAKEKVGLQIQVVAPAELPVSGAKVAHLSGVDDPKLSASQLEAIRKWIVAGGTLLIDQAGGPSAERSEAFDTAVRRIVQDWFGGTGLRSFSSVHPLVRDLQKQPYRHVDGLPRRFIAPRLEYAEHDGRPAVIYSKYDLSCALLGNPNPLARGATPEAAETILTHLLGKLTAPPKTP